MPFWILLSPHLDDAMYSCGGWIRDRADAGDRVEIWTIFAGDPPAGPLSAYAKSLHARWGLGREAAALRRAEDRRACGLVGAGYRHFDLPDCIYRTHPDTGAYLYEGDPAIFGAVAAVERERLAVELAESWAVQLPPGARVLCPLGLGGHVDHQLVRLAAERLGRELWYFADVPYVFSRGAAVEALVPEGALQRVEGISEVGFAAWMAGVRAYKSQFSSFWGSNEEMEVEFREYSGEAGQQLWRSPGGEGEAAKV